MGGILLVIGIAPIRKAMLFKRGGGRKFSRSRD
jgi:hypothetical protein